MKFQGFTLYPFQVEAVASADSWLTIEPAQIDGSGLGSYFVDLDRSQLDIGSHHSTITISSNAGSATLQVILQHESGTLGKAMAMHMAAVLPTHTAHSINLDDQYEEDVTTQLIPIVDGSSPVPDGIGCGRGALAVGHQLQ